MKTIIISLSIFLLGISLFAQEKGAIQHKIYTFVDSNYTIKDSIYNIDFTSRLL